MDQIDQKALRFRLQRAIELKNRSLSAREFDNVRIYEELIYRVGEMAEYIYKHWITFSDDDIISFLGIVEIANRLHNPKGDTEAKKREAELLDILVNQEETILKQFYNYKVAKSERELMEEQVERDFVKLELSQCEDSIAHVVKVHVLSRDRLAREPEKTPYVDTACELYKFVCAYIAEIKKLFPSIADDEMVFLHPELARAIDMLDNISIVISSQNEEHFMRASEKVNAYVNKYVKKNEIDDDSARPKKVI